MLLLKNNIFYFQLNILFVFVFVYFTPFNISNAV